MSPPQQPSLTTAAVSTVPSSSSPHASSPATVTHSVTVTVVPTLPSPTTEEFTTEAEQKLPTPVTKTVAAVPSVEMPVDLPSVVAPVAGSGSTETLTIKVEEKLTPVTAAPAPFTAAPVPKWSNTSTIVVTMAVNVDKMMWLSTLMFVASTLPIHILDSLPQATSTETMENIVFSIFCSMICFCSSHSAILSLKTALLHSINQSNIVFRFIMMILVVTFLFGFCFLFTACYLICVAALA